MKKAVSGKGCAGQSILEFVVALPLLMFILLLVIQFGIAIYAQSVVTGSAQEGARKAAEADKSVEDGLSAAKTVISAGLGTKVETAVSGSDNGELVYVEVRATVPAFLPFLDSSLKFQFHSKATMLKEGWRS
ncbi:MAG TPA: TadE family protein [Chloroflexia bacterium]|nr:TadE family protein [Chloroflexia bacterium]